MKKYKYLLLVFLFIIGLVIGQIINVVARSDIDYDKEINPIRNNIGDIIGEEIVITIPKEYNKRNIRINTSIFDGYYHYSDNDREFIVKLIINNNSSYDYKYVGDSFFLDNSYIEDNSNYLNNIILDDTIIHDSYYRSYNEALIALIPSGVDLSDDNIDTYLKYKGYLGLSDLKRYYLDYYGDSYSFDKVILGDISPYKESNLLLIKDGYWYYKNNIMSFSCGNRNCNYIFSTINKHSKLVLNNMKIIINNNACFNNYLVSSDIYFNLIRI